MNTFRVGILNPKATKLLQDLADLKLITIEEVEEFPLHDWQKKTLDERRKTAKEENYIPWNKAKKQLKFKKK
jgi:hypothetical protein